MKHLFFFLSTMVLFAIMIWAIIAVKFTALTIVSSILFVLVIAQRIQISLQAIALKAFIVKIKELMDNQSKSKS